MLIMDVDNEWELFLSGENTETLSKNENLSNIDIPKCSDIYISTKTKIAYLNSTIDLNDIFWKIPIESYYTNEECAIKKQMKFNSNNPEELVVIENNLKKAEFSNTKIITQINNSTGRIKYRDVRKISIGICKKDILNNRKKEKSAFYNCFVVILRIKIENTYKEVHVKVFNTGKLEIPGIQTDLMFHKTIQLLIKILQPYISSKLEFDKDKSETVLVNSNFTCNYFINRDKLFELLKYKYRINCNYDPCSYPGIQCKYNIDNNQQMSFMIFRTGSVLIVGKCNDSVLMNIYKFLSEMFQSEYINIHCTNDTPIKKNTVPKKKKITIYK